MAVHDTPQCRLCAETLLKVRAMLESAVPVLEDARAGIHLITTGLAAAVSVIPAPRADTES